MRFVGAVISTAKTISQEDIARNTFWAGAKLVKTLYDQFLESEEQEIADELLLSLNAARREKWSTTVESLNFKKSSRKAWSLLRKLGGVVWFKKGCPITPNAIS